MDGWKERYGNKLVTAEQSAKVVKNGDHVVFGMASPWMTPVAVCKAVAARAGELRDVTIDTTFTLVPYLGLYEPETAESWTTTSFFAFNDVEGTLLSEQHPQVGFVPLNPSFVGHLADRPFREELTRRYTAADVCVVMVSPPNAAGYVSFGSHLWNGRVQTRNAHVVIGEVNPDLPVVPGGDNWLPAQAFDYFVETEPFTLPPLLMETPEEEIDATQLCGFYTSEFVNDGDTVMFGGGAMPFRMSAFLDEKEDLGCHTEVVCPLELVRSGVINGKRRTLAPGKVSATALLGLTDEENAFLDGNPSFELRDMEVNNDPRYIARNDNMVAINAPLEVTMWGEIGVERVGPRYFRGVGGQLEFVMGALMSDGGRSIHAVISKKRSSKTGEYVSSIVPEFTRPGVATIPRQLADIVITEHGVAKLIGKTERERAAELIAVADPDFRPELTEAAKKAFGLGRTIVDLGAMS